MDLTASNSFACFMEASLQLCDRARNVKKLRVRSNIICSGNLVPANAVHNSVVGKVFNLETEECRFSTCLGFFFFSREFL